MLVFIDDSGDPGFKINKGSSRFFVIACVIFNDDLEAEKTAVALKQLRRDLGFSDKMEFKFNKSKMKVRQAFLKTLLPFDFRIRAIVVDKELIKSRELKTSKNSFYNYFIKQVLKNNKNTLREARIKLDGHGSRVFRKNLTSYLRKELNGNSRRVIKTVRLVDSKNNVLIQIADMTAGTIRRFYELNKRDSKEYYKIINKKIEDCWEFK